MRSTISAAPLMSSVALLQIENAKVFPVYKKLRAIRFLTFDTCHGPPREVRTPRALRAMPVCTSMDDKGARPAGQAGDAPALIYASADCLTTPAARPPKHDGSQIDNGYVRLESPSAGFLTCPRRPERHFAAL